MTKKAGVFITFEGAEGAGKSTQIQRLCRTLTRSGYDVCFVREPGGTVIGEKIRRILLDPKNERMTVMCEMLLYMAARAQLVAEIIRPALRRGCVVVADRFLDSTLVYQGFAGGCPVDLIRRVGKHVCAGVKPDVTFLLDIAPDIGLKRIHRTNDRIELRPLSYHRKVRWGYLRLSRREPKRIRVIRCQDRPPDEIHQEIVQVVSRLLQRRRPARRVPQAR